MQRDSVGLLEADPELARHLSAEDRATATAVRLPLRVLEPGPFELRDLYGSGAFGLIVTSGVVTRTLQLGGLPSACLLGPGDVIVPSSLTRSMLVTEAGDHVSRPTTVALLDRQVLLACRRWPTLVVGLQMRAAEQAERRLTQMAICQLPRVEDRLLSLMWFLAETWGQVTPSGTVLPLELTHSLLGSLIGARRPTVSLALRELSNRGEMVKHREGWLLLEMPETASPRSPGEDIGAARMLIPEAPAAAVREDSPGARGGTSTGRVPLLPVELVYAELRRTVFRLQAEHTASTIATRDSLDRLNATRRRAAATRVRIQGRRASRPPAPSS